MTTVRTRGTVVIDVEACKGCDLCIDACPPRVLEMTTHDVNSRGYRYPRSEGRMHGVPGVCLDLPRLLLPGVQVRHPARAHGPGRRARMTQTAPAPRLLLEGSEAIADAMVAAGCRFFAGYPMTPFTEILEHMAAKLPTVGGVCMNAESELEAVGMAWGAAATGTPSATGSTGQGLSLMLESISEAAYAWIPLVVINMARAQGDYWQATRGPGHGDSRMPVLAPMDVPEAAELAQYAFYLAAALAQPGAAVRRLLPRAHVDVGVDRHA